MNGVTPSQVAAIENMIAAHERGDSVIIHMQMNMSRRTWGLAVQMWDRHVAAHDAHRATLVSRWSVL